MEWKSPHDIMRTHKIRRSSSDVSKTPSPTMSLTRKLSSGSKAKNRNVPVLQKSLSESNCPSGSNIVSLKKRRNPFGRDSEIRSSPRKKRSVLNLSDVNTSTSVSADIPDLNHLQKPASLDLAQGSKLIEELNNVDEQLKTTFFSENQANEINTVPEKTNLHTCSNENLNSEVSRQQKQTSQIVCDGITDFSSLNNSQFPPVDWSLKTKLRIVSAADLDVGKKPGIDARHMNNFVHHKLEADSEWSQLDLCQQVRRCCFHYSYPNLPWLQTFPRTSNHFRTRLPSIAAGSEEIAQSLHRDWSSAFTSIYQQLRSGICPYFYLCCHQFTVLFRCQRSESHTSWSALLTPSTRGLRELLIKEGISFTLPLLSEKNDKPHKEEGDSADKKLSSPSHKKKELSAHDDNKLYSNDSGCLKENIESSRTINETNDAKENSLSDKENSLSDKENYLSDKDDSEDEVEDHQVASLWLEGMGLDRKDFPSLEPNKVKIQMEGYREIDNRPTSMVYVEGPDIHPFFDFLLNYSGCFASSGPQQGIPPTILSSVPFVGGTLAQNNVKVSTLRDVNGGAKPSQVFEISGPLIPHHILNVSSILRSLRLNSSSALSLSTHTSTAAFNTQKTNDPEKDKMAAGWNKITVNVSQANCGLLEDVKHLLCDVPTLHHGEYLKDMRISSDGFAWV